MALGECRGNGDVALSEYCPAEIIVPPHYRKKFTLILIWQREENFNYSSPGAATRALRDLIAPTKLRCIVHRILSAEPYRPLVL